MNNANANIVTLAKMVNEKSTQFIDARKGLAEGTHEVDFTVRVQGAISVGIAYDTAPTVSIPLLEALALMLHYCGITREHAKTMLTRILRESLEINGTASGALTAALPWVTAMVETIKADIIAELPRQPRKGVVRTNVTFTEVTEPHTVLN